MTLASDYSCLTLFRVTDSNGIPCSSDVWSIPVCRLFFHPTYRQHISCKQLTQEFQEHNQSKMFGLLDDDDEVGGQVAAAKVDKEVAGGDLALTSATQAEATDSAWTDVSSSKSRRLAPQWTSSKQEATSSTAATDSSKKKGSSVSDFILSLRFRDVIDVSLHSASVYP